MSVLLRLPVKSEGWVLGKIRVDEEGWVYAAYRVCELVGGNGLNQWAERDVEEECGRSVGVAWGADVTSTGVFLPPSLTSPIKPCFTHAPTTTTTIHLFLLLSFIPLTTSYHTNFIHPPSPISYTRVPSSPNSASHTPPHFTQPALSPTSTYHPDLAPSCLTRSPSSFIGLPHLYNSPPSSHPVMPLSPSPESVSLSPSFIITSNPTQIIIVFNSSHNPSGSRPPFITISSSIPQHTRTYTRLSTTVIPPSITHH
ncbi:hypothetical protein Pmani_025403 [Petrolisthes manimaculis]|uniref:Uncharacterized protein n=1 Tax=Petrolisthes manimaculis TaxID=1843537 RepID=A0AAE1TYZ6_9EUCA|nr:hypothetical protein Pmani_025403 [Petrolisthes manimaculis]